MGWNGQDLIDEFSAQLGDTSSAFEARVLNWINEIQDDICARHPWPFLRKTGQKVLTASAERHTIYPDAAGAPTVALASGLGLTDKSSYEVGITFYEATTGYETQIDNASDSVTADDGNSTSQIRVTAIPTSSDPLVTARKVYLRKESDKWYYVGTISDNTTTTYTISSDTTSTIEAPDYIGIQKIDGSPWIESISEQLRVMSEDQIRLLFPGTFSSGTPEFYYPVSQTEVLLYPTPSTALTLNFNYFKVPARVYNSLTSQPDMPIWMKSALRAGITWKGYEYRERDGVESKYNNYEQEIRIAIQYKAGKIDAPAIVRDVLGDSDGFIIS